MGGFLRIWRHGVERERKVVLITGGTSGIGLAAAKRFLEKGFAVSIAGRSEARGRAAVRTLQETIEHGTRHEAHVEERILFVPADVCRVDACRNLVQQIVAHFGRLDVLVNSAGAYLEGAIDDMTEQDFDRILAVNLKGTYFLCQAALPELRQTKGCIVNVGSDAGLHGNYFCTAYCAAKGGVSLFTRALALEVAHVGVRVNAIAPGDLLTPLTEQQLAQAGNRDEALREMASVYPVGHIGTADDAAAAICYLASEDAGFITGTILSIDGGLTA